jgi:hypothetical protein
MELCNHMLNRSKSFIKCIFFLGYDKREYKLQATIHHPNLNLCFSRLFFSQNLLLTSDVKTY